MNESARSALTIERFEAASIDPASFDHEAHVYVGWLYVMSYPGNEAIARGLSDVPVLAHSFERVTIRRCIATPDPENRGIVQVQRDDHVVVPETHRGTCPGRRGLAHIQNAQYRPGRRQTAIGRALEQPFDFTFVVDVDCVGRRDTRQPRHRHY